MEMAQLSTIKQEEDWNQKGGEVTGGKKKTMTDGFGSAGGVRVMDI